MDRQGVKVFLAVAIGVGLGILAGREVHAAIGWLVGALIGGAAGYVTVAPVAAFRAVPTAWRTVHGWPVRSLFRLVRWWTYATFGPTATVILSATVLVRSTKSSAAYESWTIEMPTSALVLFLFFGLLTAMFTRLEPRRDEHGHLADDEPIWARTLNGSTDMMRLVVYALFPPMVFGYHLPRALWWLTTRGLPRLARFSARLGVTWFRLVHSDLRLLCLADAFLFAGVGTLVGGPILAWMLAGGAFGALNYEVVSKRWLKLAPARVRHD